MIYYLNKKAPHGAFLSLRESIGFNIIQNFITNIFLIIFIIVGLV